MYRAEIDRLRAQIHKERNDAAIQYGEYEAQLREMRLKLKELTQ